MFTLVSINSVKLALNKYQLNMLPLIPEVIFNMP